jgi:uncharacterized SAM-binding protein YcdF (DUF218 family)
MPRRLLLALLAVIGVLCLLALAGIPLFVLYPEDELPARADAVVVLAGSDSRLPVALRLMEQNVAPVLVVSDPEGRHDEARRTLCAGGAEGFELVCELPDPYSTRGEARLIARLAAERGWDSLVVVTSDFHLFRARRLIERCYHGELALHGAPVEWWYWPVAIGTEWAKLAVAETLRRGC